MIERSEPTRSWIGTRTLEECAAAFGQPHRILLIIKAGEAVDEMLEKLTPRLAPGAVGRGAHGVAMSDDGGLVFIANTFAGTVSVINTMAQHVLATVRVGAGPGGITYRAPTP